MDGDPIPGPHDVLRILYQLPQLKGRKKAEAIARLEELLKKTKRARKS